ncbi:MAG: type VI secretion system baseplate subunit TssF [Hellea sp.]|nr:type VI secretion system baseplate subunit TssF [Hellea sp.]
MDPRLLDFYEAELKYLRDQSKNFAKTHQTAGRRLGLNSTEPDPYVERLLEGVAFLSSRVRLKINDQFPEFTQHLLQAIQPHYLAPSPSMCITAFEPKAGDPGLAAGFPVPRRTRLTANPPESSQTPIIFETGHEVILWPLEITKAEYIHSRAATAKFATIAGVRANAAITLRIESTSGIDLNIVEADFLDIFLEGSEAIPNELYRQMIGEAVAVVGRAVDAKDEYVKLELPAQCGFDDEDSLLPNDGRTLGAYRMLTEYFACPERFRFVKLSDLQKIIPQSSKAIEITILFSRSSDILRQSVDKRNFRLFATPAINLFEKQMNRVGYKPEEHHLKVTPDRSARLDFEVFRLLDVKAYDQDNSNPQTVEPLYAFGSHLYEHQSALFYATTIKMRTMSRPERRSLGREYYIGTDTFINLTSPGNPQRLDDIHELSIRALVTNRELPEELKRSGDTQLVFSGLPVQEVNIISGPTRPLPPMGIGDAAWRVIGHLTPNFASGLSDKNGDAEMLRDHLALYGRQDDSVMRTQIDGIMSVKSRKITRRIPGLGRLALARGLMVDVELDDSVYDQASAFVFSAVVERFLAEFAVVNSFTETRFYSNTNGELAKWPPRIGRR